MPSISKGSGGRVMRGVRCLPKVNCMISKLKPLLYALLVLGCLSPHGSRTMSATAGVYVALSRENTQLRKFGVRLPASAKIEAKIKQPYTRAVHLFIKLPVDDLNTFIGLLEKIPPRPGMVAYAHSEETRLGSIPVAYDWPEDFLHRWEQTHSAKLGLVGFFTFSKKIESGERKGEYHLKSYLVIFADKKKGLMWMYYR